MKKNQKLLAAAAGIVVIAALFAGIWFAARPAASKGSKNFTVEVVHGSEPKKNFSFTTDAEYLGEALLSEGLIQGESSEFGLFVTEVDGETADYEKNQTYWAFYVNGEYAQQGIDQTPVHDGDQFSLVFTVSNG